MVASVAEQASLSLTWSETPEDTFSHVAAHIIMRRFEWKHDSYGVHYLRSVLNCKYGNVTWKKVVALCTETYDLLMLDILCI